MLFALWISLNLGFPEENALDGRGRSPETDPLPGRYWGAVHAFYCVGWWHMGRENDRRCFFWGSNKGFRLLDLCKGVLLECYLPPHRRCC